GAFAGPSCGARPAGSGVRSNDGTWLEAVVVSGRTARRRVLRLTVPEAGQASAGVTASARADLLAAEEPLGIRVDGTALTMTMRTPGDDVELAAGFLVGEAIVRGRDDIAGMKVCDGTG